MPFPPNHWFNVLKVRNTRQLETMLEVLTSRLLPCFDNLDAEADAKAEEKWQALGQMPCGEYGPLIDEGDAAEIARDAGLEHYEALSSAKQAVLNSFAVLIFHMWEQQLLAFHRRQLLHPREENDPKLLNLKEIQTRLLVTGVDVTALESWKRLRIYRLLANTVKHADGDAATRLKRERPDWFISPSLDDWPQLPISSPRTYLPLAGEDVYVRLKDVEDLVDAASSFWKELIDALEKESDARA